MLFVASGRGVGWLDAGSLWRLRTALSVHGLADLRPRLRKRAAVHRFHGHPGELRRLLADRALVSSGISAAGEHGLGLVSSGEVDGYVPAGRLGRLRREHALEAADRAEANVVLRAISDSAWHFEAEATAAPLAAVALDLAEDPDPRSARVGAQALADLDRKRRRRPRLAT